MVKMVLRFATLAIAIWALIIAYQAKDLAKWVDNKQENIIEKLMFPQYENDSNKK
jgi:hypothetical protein